MCYSCNGVDVCFLIKQIVYTCLRKGAKHFCAISLAISLAVVNVSVFSLFTKAQGR